jgi:hypothetical protein
MANPGTRTRKPKPPPVERDLAIRMFEVMVLAHGRRRRRRDSLHDDPGILI